jgi:hypothetical protein
MEGRLRFFLVQFNFFSYILTLISISIIKKNFLGHTDILTYGNDIFVVISNQTVLFSVKVKGKSLQMRVVENALNTTFFDHILTL